MLHRESTPIRHELLSEQWAAVCMSSALTRVAGLCTLAAFFAWLWGGVYGAQFIGQRIVQLNCSLYMNHMLSLQQPPEDLPSADATANPAIDDVQDPVAEGVRLLNEARQGRQAMRTRHVKQARERNQEFSRRMGRLVKVQGAITIGWLVAMILAGVFLLCAAMAGLIGSERTRKWHRLAACWVLFATTCTIAGMWALTRWGGFPAIPDPWIVVKIGAVQSSYAIAIIVAGLVTYRRSPSEE